MIRIKTSLSERFIIILVVLASLIPDVGIRLSTAGFHWTFYRIVIFASITFILFIREGKIVFYKRPFSVGVIAIFVIWIVYGLVLLLFSRYSDHHTAFIELLSLANAFFVLVIFCSSVTPDDFESITKSIVWLTNILIVFAFFEILTGRHLFFSAFNDVNSSFYYYSNKHMATGFSYNCNDFSAMISCMMPMLLIAEKDNYKWLSIFGVFIINVFNDANICNFSVLVSLALYLLFFNDSFDLGHRVNRFVTLSILVLIGITPFFFKKILSFTQRRVFGAISTQISNAQLGTGSLFKRLNIYKDVLSGSFNDYPLGCGPSSFSNYFSQNGSFSGLVNPHSLFFEILFEYGIIIFCLFVGCLILIVYRALHSYKNANSKTIKKYNALVVLSITSYSIASFAPSTFLGYAYQWIILAFCCIIVDYDKEYYEEVFYA